MAEFIPSKYQEAIFKAVAETNDNLVIEATAGAAKTTSIIKSIDYIKDLAAKKVIFLAFNKNIATELQSRIPKSVKSATIHATGFGVIKRNNPKSIFEADKVHIFMERLSSKWNVPFDEKISFFNKIEDAVNFGRYYWDGELSLKRLNQICYDNQIILNDEELDYSFETLTHVINTTEYFDYPDMVFMSVKNNYKFPQFDVTFIDESQDLSSIERQFVLKLVKPGGRFIAVGDKNQAIYGFKGSSIDSMDLLAKEPRVKTLPLSISYRCSKAVTRHAQELVPTMEHREFAPEGSVILNGSVNNIKNGDVVLCRINWPLMKLTLAFIKAGRPVAIKGSDIGRNLIKMLKSYKTNNSIELVQKLAAKGKKMIERAKIKYPTKDVMLLPEIQIFNDKFEIVKAILEKYKTINEAIAFLNRIYTDDDSTTDKVLASSAHKFKGLESKNVFILEPHLIPFPYVKTENEKLQERNIDFVARTRAIDKLEYIKDWYATKKDFVNVEIK